MMFLVMRTHTVSHAARRVSWQVISRPFDTRQAAEDFRCFCEAEYREEQPRGTHRFFVIETDFQGTLP